MSYHTSKLFQIQSDEAKLVDDASDTTLKNDTSELQFHVHALCCHVLVLVAAFVLPCNVGFMQK